jgi:hypothetical protein
MSNKGTAAERIARMKKEKAAAHTASKDQKKNDLVGQLTHENDGSTDFSEIAQKLENIKAHTAKGENEGHVKMTIYVREDIARSFNALITKRGQQKAFVNQALSDFIQKKSIELGL